MIILVEKSTFNNVGRFKDIFGGEQVKSFLEDCEVNNITLEEDNDPGHKLNIPRVRFSISPEHANFIPFIFYDDQRFESVKEYLNYLETKEKLKFLENIK